jgi:hypothetical protein
MGTLLYGAGLAYELLARRAGGTKQRVLIAAGVILVAVAVWTELAVGAMSQLAQFLISSI